MNPDHSESSTLARDRVTARFVQRHGRECAYIPFAGWQRAFYLIVMTAIILLLFYRWDICILLVTAWASLWYLAAACFKGIAALRSLRGDGIEQVTPEQIAQLNDADLPVYTILVPLYHEAKIAGKIVHSIERLDYPVEKLDVKLLLEAEDKGTLQAVADCDLPPCCEVIVVPDGQPRTKPRACNHGLEAARGEFCVIYDAEDRPDPDQLKKAVGAFSRLSHQTACLQAALNYFNGDQNWLTRWFTIEYSTTFDLYLPGVQTMGVPVPLGGTSNHFRTDVLREVGGWDPFNVTEDCDLGIRLYKYGYTTLMLQSTTWEEANSKLWNWIRQRSRWVKGFLQTHLVHMRHPFTTARQLGVRGMAGFYLAVGAGTFMMIVNVFYWVLGALYLGLLWHGHQAGQTLWGMVHGPHAIGLYRGIKVGGLHVRAWPLVFSGANESSGWVAISMTLFSISLVLLFANLFFVLIHVIACIRRRNIRLIPMALLMPFYWVLISVGAWKGGWQLLTRPFYWEKTIHGLDTARQAGIVPFVKRLWAARRRTSTGAALFLFVSSATLLTAREAGWYAGTDPFVQMAPATTHAITARVPDGGLLFRQNDIHTFRATRAMFEAERLVVDVKDVSEPVVARLFVQDQDGAWFQTRQSWPLKPGTPTTLSAKLARHEHAFAPRGHAAQWHAGHAVSMITVGIALTPRGGDAQSITISSSTPRLEGKRQRRDLKIVAWTLPSNVTQREMHESRFELTREYFNPFDPDEIRVNVQIKDPEGKTQSLPAFFGLDCRRALLSGKESVDAVGAPYWAYRFTPPMPGRYQHRLVVKDRSGGSGLELTTDWRICNVEPSDARGFVGVDPENAFYFSFQNGELFFPIALNLHAIFDPRGSGVLGRGTLPDYGTYSFDDYFSKMSSNGVNAAEIWMASWSMGLEWSSERRGYRGLGRYNMLNAWRLDHLMQEARKRGIYIHLILDNHGKLSTHSDPEWAESPFNTRAPFARADGAFLMTTTDFFSDDRAFDFTARRNRYIVARWGQDPTIFGVELWSEGNLVTQYSKLYESGIIVDWSKRVIEHLRESGLKQLVTTHFCGDYKNNLKFRRLTALPEIQYIVGDAYRKKRTMASQLRLHDKHLAPFKKPRLVTEFGGSWAGATHPMLEADLHAGLWGSLFTRQAGTPMLWWHAFIHYKCGYGHYKGFAAFIDGIDLRAEGRVTNQPLILQGNGVDALAAGYPEERYAWFTGIREMKRYPEQGDTGRSPYQKVKAGLNGFTPGTYKIEWWDTLNGPRSQSTGEADENGTLMLAPPAFFPDIAAKIVKVGKGGASK